MTSSEDLFHEIARSIPDAKEGKMFGALCIKAPNGKAAAMFWKGYMIFKLKGAVYEEALALEGAKVFDPMDGRPMNGWVQLAPVHSARWSDLAHKAMEQVRLL